MESLQKNRAHATNCVSVMRLSLSESGAAKILLDCERALAAAKSEGHLSLSAEVFSNIFSSLPE